MSSHNAVDTLKRCSGIQPIISKHHKRVCMSFALPPIKLFSSSKKLFAELSFTILSRLDKKTSGEASAKIIKLRDNDLHTRILFSSIFCTIPST